LEIKKKVDVLSYPNAIFNEKKKQIWDSWFDFSKQIQI
jgi:hypothetical protein